MGGRKPERGSANSENVVCQLGYQTLPGIAQAAAHSGAIARYDARGRDAGVDGKTAKAHVDVLERLFLVRIRRSWHVNLGKRWVKAPKLYVADPGLLAALVGADARRVREDDGFAGALFETFVANELERKRHGRQNR
jgi:predicted AAA+ superfamily ATPase